jgi:hypothetical protein
VRQFKNMSLDGHQLYDDTIAAQDSDAVNSLNTTTTPMSNTGTTSVPKHPGQPHLSLFPYSSELLTDTGK